MNPEAPLTKRAALEMLGGDATTAARAIGCSPQAVRQWPDPLSPRLADRVYAARWRQEEALRFEKKRRWAEAQEAGRASPVVSDPAAKA
jgi:hypothetical protein